ARHNQPRTDRGAKPRRQLRAGANPQAPQSGVAEPQSSPLTHAAAALPGVRYARAWRGSNRQLPTSTFGKIFFTKGGQEYVCSGTVVAAANKSVVWTAGHCVEEHGKVHTNWIFVPGYRNG